MVPQLSRDLSAVSGRKIPVNTLQPSCKDCLLHSESSLEHPFDCIQQERLAILELKTFVMGTTRMGALSFHLRVEMYQVCNFRPVFNWKENAWRSLSSLLQNKNRHICWQRNPCVWCHSVGQP
ncbi:hypothetical protein TNCV_986151 [Trichonephila clavipes]|uniref:Uncharacterized protein n=1 Tax=Trichonephila clavipes TaxID=2585209 RepID=A0A8X6SLY4_TRICX|nr:hypothetical protein TNCV_986151 [Trichonephila clavipes]